MRKKIKMDTRIKEWEKLKYISPVKVLPKLRQLQLELAQRKDVDEKIKDLRIQKLKHHAEKRIGAIFCFGLACYIQKSIFFTPAPSNDLDYDIISKYKDGDTVRYIPIQLKEIVPERISSETDLNNELQKLQNKYPTSTDITIVVQYNRREKFRLSEVKIPKLNIKELWIIGASTPDQSKWYFAGNMLDNPGIFEIKYPV